MSVYYIDPPGPLANTYEPIDFTTDRPVTSISVEYNPSIGNGLRETVWDGTSDVDNTGGDFSYLYRTSTRTGTGPYLWTIRRAGRWPASFRIRIKEADESVSAGGQAYKVLYDVDLRAAAASTLAPGANTILGKEWWLKGYVDSVNGESAVMVPGAGLRVTSYRKTQYAYVDGDMFAQDLGERGGYQLYMDFADNVPGYNPNAPVFIQMVMNDFSTEYPSNFMAWTSLYACAKSSALTLKNERVGGCISHSRNSPSNRGVFTYAAGGNTYISSGYAVAFSSVCLTVGHPGFACAVTGGFNPNMGADIGQYVDLNQLSDFQVPFVAECPRLSTPRPAMPSLGVCLWPENHLGIAFGPQVATYRRFRVLQPATVIG